MVVFTFSVLDLEYQFWANLVQNVKIVSLNWNLVLILIQICRVQEWIYFSCFQQEISFLNKLGPKNQNCHFKLNLVLRIIRVSRIQYWRLFFYFWLRGFFFGENLFQKIKIVCWNWNLEPRLIQISRIRWWFSIFSFLDRKYYFQIN